MTQHRSMIIASEHFLSKVFPDNWDTLSDLELDLFIEEHRSDVTYAQSVELITECIVALSETIIEVFEEAKLGTVI